MHGGKAADDGPVLHKTMSRKRGVIGHDDVVSDRAVMRHMHIGHEQVAVTDAGDAAAAFRSPVQGGKFADAVAAADDQTAEVLRFAAHHGMGVNVVVLSHGGIALD